MCSNTKIVVSIVFGFQKIARKEVDEHASKTTDLKIDDGQCDFFLCILLLMAQ